MTFYEYRVVNDTPDWRWHRLRGATSNTVYTAYTICKIEVSRSVCKWHVFLMYIRERCQKNPSAFCRIFAFQAHQKEREGEKIIGLLLLLREKAVFLLKETHVRLFVDQTFLIFLCKMRKSLLNIFFLLCIENNVNFLF